MYNQNYKMLGLHIQTADTIYFKCTVLMGTVHKCKGHLSEGSLVETI